VTIYLDTSAPGGKAFSATGQVYEFGAEVEFYFSVASNFISGQSTGPSVQFTIYSRKAGPYTLNIDYGTTNTNYAVRLTGYLINATVPTSGGSVSCRVVVSTDPFPLMVQFVSAAVTNTVSTNLQKIASVTVPTVAGGLPIEDGLGAGNLLSVNVANQLLDTPAGGDLTSGALKSNQLPAALDGGFLEVSIKKPTTVGGGGTYVDVHDIGP